MMLFEQYKTKSKYKINIKIIVIRGIEDKRIKNLSHSFHNINIELHTMIIYSWITQIMEKRVMLFYHTFFSCKNALISFIKLFSNLTKILLIITIHATLK